MADQGEIRIELPLLVSQLKHNVFNLIGMKPRSQSEANHFQTRASLFESVIGDLTQALELHVSFIEERSPGHRFGRRVVAHMVELGKQAKDLGCAEGLTPDQVQLLELGLSIHDIGRVLCEYERPGDKEFQHQHGEIGARYLRDHHFLSALDQVDASIILDMVEQHSTKEVSLDADSLSYQLCYVLRDLDKVALIENHDGFLSPSGALNQISMWMLSEPSKADLRSLLDEDRVQLFKFIAPILEGKHIPESPASESTLAQEILGHLTRPVPDELIRKVADGQLLSKPEMISGYPAYMLAQIALVNDLKSAGVKSKVNSEGLLKARAAYINFVGPNMAPAIEKVFARL